MSPRASSSGRGSGPLSSRHIRWAEFDWHIVLIAALLLSVGMYFIHAMSLALGNDEINGVSFEGHRQKIVMAVPALLLGLFVRPQWLRRQAWVVYGGALVLLLLVPLIGDERNSARRWIELPLIKFDLQPSELAKIAVILMLAKVLDQNPLESLRDWLKPLLVALVPMLMVAAQPDLGTSLTIVPVTVGLIYLAGGRARALLSLAGLGVLVGATAFSLGFVRAYQLERVETWLDSFSPDELIASRNGPGFHTYHARVAIGNGGLEGRGIGEGVANETGLLPERDCDSIFAVIAEEGGFYGAAAVVALYTLLVVLMMASAAGMRDRFGRLVVGGVAIYFGAHLFINVSVNLGVLPMTGLTLPLLSTGGSSLLATFLALGLALGQSSHHEASLDSDAFRPF
ncbi:MAG: FtsW/RodA/SpoVE family cell cycle protein [Planctomycetota bacterium]